MKHTHILLILAVALLVLSVPVYSQTVLLPTTLSSAISDSKGQVMVVASATNFVAGTTVAYIDRELVSVKAVNSTTIGIIRGQGGTFAAPHASSALVFVGQQQQFFTVTPQGACTRSAELVLPRINVKTGEIADCLGGEWAIGLGANGAKAAAKLKVLSPDPGGIIYTSLNTNGTTLGSTTMYCSEVYLPANKLLSGIAILNGTTVGTDNHLVALYDSAGTLLANSAVAGVLAAGASTYQERSFTSKFFAVGPATYFGCMQTNGNTATVRMAITQVADNILTKGQTGVTFGTIPALTVPTTFTTAVGPYIYLF